MKRELVAAILLAIAPAVMAQDLELRRKPLDRRFPASHCPFETRDVDPANGAFGLYFTAIGPQARLHFEAPNQNSDGWFEHAIDNIVVVERSVFEANRGPSPGFEGCYEDTLAGFPNFEHDAPALYFNRFPTSAFPLLELFDTTPAGDPSRPWDLTQGAYYLAQGDSTTCDAFGFPETSSAPRNPEAGTDCSGGALGLGRETDGDILVKTSIPLTGLVAGVEYIVTGWWNMQGNLRDNVLTVTVTAPAPNGNARLLALNDVAQSSGVDQLVRLADLSTGVGTLVGSLGNGFVESEAMAVQRTPQGLDRVFVVDDDRLLELDPATGNGTLIGPIGFPDVDGIAFHPTTGVLYGVTYSSSQLIRIDTTTGDGTLVADDFLVSRHCEDIAFHPDGRCFVLTGGSPRIYQVNPATGEKLQRWDLSGASSLESLVWSPDGNTLYSAADRGGFKDLVRIDLAAGGAVSFVSSLHSGFPDVEALAWVSPAIDQLLAHWSSPTDAPAPRAMTRLYPSVPNPFNPTTTITYDLAVAGTAELAVLDVAGRRIASLATGAHDAGRHRAVWDGRDAGGHSVASGLYVVRLQAGSHTSMQRLVLVR